jgi:predicted  nucleic acid-binding Zn-ribbon protein
MNRMGPTNVALVKLYQADQHLREAQGRLDAVSKDVRVQERRVHDLAERLKLAQVKLRENQSHAGQLELDVKSRDARIDKLRTQQQNAKNNKEYQAFLVEINTEKVDKAKVEEQQLASMDSIEKGQTEVKELAAHVQAEQAKLETMRAQIGEKVAALQAEIDALKPKRETAAAAVPPKAIEAYRRLADRLDGEAMSAIEKPDRRREEYNCNACMMGLVVDIYNRLHTRDELVFCPSCYRILYIPADLPPEEAVGTGRPAPRAAAPAKPRAPRKTKAKSSAASSAGGESTETEPAEVRPPSKYAELLRAAHGESVKNAIDADQAPVECEVTIDGEPMGIIKGKSRENLERVIKFRMGEANLSGTVVVTEKAAAAEPEPAMPEAATSESSMSEPSNSEPSSSSDATESAESHETAGNPTA